MTEQISRRKFLKLAGFGAATAAVLTGCGPVSRYIVRKPYTDMPEYNQTGLSTYYATACRECPAGCGILVRTKEGRALTIEGNPNHPVNHGKLCARGITAQQGLYNPDRIKGPLFQARGQNASPKTITWDEGLTLLQKAFTDSPAQTAFLLGLAPDHLYDLTVNLSEALGALKPVRYSALTTFEGRATLVEAVRRTFGKPTLPYFDLAMADVAFAFGANFLENFISPVTYTGAYGKMRRGNPRRRGVLVVFEPRMSLTAANADEWIPIIPGSEAILALGLGRLIAEERGTAVPDGFKKVTIDDASAASGVSEDKLRELAKLFATSEHPLAIPGGGFAGHEQGLLAAEAALQINGLVDNLGKPGGLFLAPIEPDNSGLSELKTLVQAMKDGQVKTLLIHGVNPLFELPKALGFEEALTNVPLVISFASFPDETALASDYILPDHTPLESFGYQRMLGGTDRPSYSSFQPVVVPLYDTHATADVLIAAAQAAGGKPAAALNFTDEVDFIQQQAVPLISAGGFYTAPEILTFWSLWLQYGGWWTRDGQLEKPGKITYLKEVPELIAPAPLEEGKQFHVVVYPGHMGDGSGANRPWLQEMPDPMTTVVWNSWVEIHPETADKLGIHDDDVVRISTPYGFVDAVVYRYPAIRPDTLGLPFGQGHTALGRWAEGRGFNPAHLLPTATNEAGDLAFGDVVASISLTGQRRPLGRIESKAGVYGEH